MPRLLSVRSIYAIVVKTVSGCVGGESISGPKIFMCDGVNIRVITEYVLCIADSSHLGDDR